MSPGPRLSSQPTRTNLATRQGRFSRFVDFGCRATSRSATQAGDARTCLLTVFILLGLCSVTPAQTSLADYTGADRMARIAAAARQEGSLTLYTSITAKDLPPLVKPFEAKYGIKVNVWRAGTSNVLQRTVSEASARRFDVDVVHIGSPEMEALAREQVLRPITSPTHKDLQPGSVPAHRAWAATMLSVWVQEIGRAHV